MAIKKYLSLERLEEYDALIKAKIDSDIESHTHSWNDLKDKPFGEDIVLTEIYSDTIDSSDFSYINSSTGAYVYELSSSANGIGIIPDMSIDYYVKINDIMYKTKSIYGEELGNNSLFSEDEEDTGEPFYISLPTLGYAPDTFEVDSSIYADSYDFKIYTGTATTKLLDEQYIPDTIARTADVDTALANKADKTHSHNDLYYTESEVDNLISGVNTSISNITSGTTVVKNATHAVNADNATNANHATNADEAAHAASADTATSAASATKATQDASGNVITSTYETKTDATAKLAEAKSYTDTKVSGMATTTVVDNKISAHNSSTTAHSDIRDLISVLTTKVNNFLDVDDTTTDQLSEVLELIESNKGTLDSITSNKVNVSDIVDNLTTSISTKVLSASQGVVLKALIDDLQIAIDGKADVGHTHSWNELEDRPFGEDVVLTEAKTITVVTHDSDGDGIINSATRFSIPLSIFQDGESYCYVKLNEVMYRVRCFKTIDEWEENELFIGNSSMQTSSTTDTTDTGDSFLIYYREGMSSEGSLYTSVSGEYTFTLFSETQGIKTIDEQYIPSTIARTTYVDETVAEINIAIANKSDKGHSHEISEITNLQTTLDGKAAKSHTHTVSEISDITATATELNYMDGVTSNVQTQIDTVSGNLSTHTGNADIHFTAAERTKLAGIATGATKVTVDSALSSTSTNPVQNKAVNSAISTATSAISANTSSIDAHTGRITALETKVGDGFEEISSQEIQSLFAQ